MSARYNGQEGHREAVRAAAEELVEANMMRAEDVEFVVVDALEFPSETQ